MWALRPVLLERSAIAHLGRSEQPAWLRLLSPWIQPTVLQEQPNQPRQSIDGRSRSSPADKLDGRTAPVEAGTGEELPSKSSPSAEPALPLIEAAE